MSETNGAMNAAVAPPPPTPPTLEQALRSLASRAAPPDAFTDGLRCTEDHPATCTTPTAAAAPSSAASSSPPAMRSEPVVGVAGAFILRNCLSAQECDALGAGVRLLHSTHVIFERLFGQLLYHVLCPRPLPAAFPIPAPRRLSCLLLPPALLLLRRRGGRTFSTFGASRRRRGEDYIGPYQQLLAPCYARSLMQWVRVASRELAMWED